MSDRRPRDRHDGPPHEPDVLRRPPQLGDRLHRAAGVLLGQACGDALGVPYEFSARVGDDETPTMRGGGLGPYDPGEWSDDTQMAVCVAQGLAPVDDDSLERVAEGFLRWRSGGASDVGVQTSAVLGAAGRAEGPPADRLRTAARDHAATHGLSAGNGALMRTSVVGLAHAGDRSRTAALAADVASLTHADPLAVESCVLWTEAVRVAVDEGQLDLAGGIDLLEPAARDAWTARIDAATGADPRQFAPDGFTVTALQAAWASITSTPVPEPDPAAGRFDCQHLRLALEAAVRVGDDTDTVAAVAGGLLGAYWGVSAVPARWRRDVHGWPGLRARDLVRLALVVAEQDADPDEWPAGAHVDYSASPTTAVGHPLDDQVVLGTARSRGHDADAVVSLCRLGVSDVPAPGVAPRDHLEVWLVDNSRPVHNPNLEFVLADAVDAVELLRAEGRRVLLHCVAANNRTPSVAAAYARRLGASPAEAADAVLGVLPHAKAHGRLWETALR